MSDQLNLRLNLPEDSGDNAEKESRIKDAQARKKSANESLPDAWDRIMQSKSYANNQAKMDAVKNAMLSGELGREEGAKGKFSGAEALRLYKALAAKEKERKLAELVETTPANYRLITTEAQMTALVKALRNEATIAVDTETTGVDVYTDVIVGISFTLPKLDAHVYIPVDHAEDTPQLSRDYVLDALKPVLYDESIGKVLFNAMFDIAMFRRHGSDLLGVTWDGMIAMHLLNENEPSFKLKDLAPKYLNAESDTFAELFGKDAQFREVPLDLALVYAAKDTDLTYRLYEFQREHLSKYPLITEYYDTVEIPLLYLIVDLEANGYILDLDFAKEYGKELHDRAESLQTELIENLTPYAEGDGEINLNSTQQMRPAISKLIGEELPNMDAKKTLKPLRSKHAIIDNLLEYKKVAKLSGTYIDTLPTKQNPTTKRWHSRFNPIGTVTGRFSSGKDEEDKTGQGFNVQNQPEEARRMFVAPPGKVLVGADFKAQEIRCVAYLSGEPVLIDAFLTGRDPYASMASTYYKRPYAEVYKNEDGSDTPERKKFKVVWLATLYGMSDFSLAEMLGTSKDDAVKFKKDIFGTMPDLEAWLKENEEFVRKNGFVWADNKYRKRRLPDAKLSKKKIPYGKYRDPKYTNERLHNSSINRAMRQATNARVQGSSSIQTKVTMLRAHEYCKDKQGWSLWGSIHDELIFEVPEDFTPAEAEDIRDIMVNSYAWGETVPNGTDIEVMRRWGEGVALKDWFDNKDAQ